jgi:hypothetical protein
MSMCILGWAKNLCDKILRQCKLRNNIRKRKMVKLQAGGYHVVKNGK